MGHRKCGGLRDFGMTLQRVIDLRRRDFLAAPIDHLGLAAVKSEEAVRVEASDIAGSKPAIHEGSTVELGGVEIARRQGRPAEQDLAVLAGATSRPLSATTLTVPFAGMPHVPGFDGPGGGRFAEICAASLEP